LNALVEENVHVRLSQFPQMSLIPAYSAINAGLVQGKLFR